MKNGDAALFRAVLLDHVVLHQIPLDGVLLSESLAFLRATNEETAGGSGALSRSQLDQIVGYVQSLGLERHPDCCANCIMLLGENAAPSHLSLFVKMVSDFQMSGAKLTIAHFSKIASVLVPQQTVDSFKSNTRFMRFLESLDPAEAGLLFDRHLTVIRALVFLLDMTAMDPEDRSTDVLPSLPRFSLTIQRIVKYGSIVGYEPLEMELLDRCEKAGVFINKNEEKIAHNLLENVVQRLQANDSISGSADDGDLSDFSSVVGAGAGAVGRGVDDAATSVTISVEDESLSLDPQNENETDDGYSRRSAADRLPRSWDGIAANGLDGAGAVVQVLKFRLKAVGDDYVFEPVTDDEEEEDDEEDDEDHDELEPSNVETVEAGHLEMETAADGSILVGRHDDPALPHGVLSPPSGRGDPSSER